MASEKPTAIPVSDLVTLESEPPAVAVARGDGDPNERTPRIVANYAKKRGFLRRLLHR